MLTVHKRFIRELERRGDARPRARVPARRDTEIDARHAAGVGLTSPEFSVLVAYSKMTLDRTTCSTPGCPTSPGPVAAARLLPAGSLVERTTTGSTRTRCAARSSPTPLVNDLVNRAGITFVFRRLRGDRCDTGRGRARLRRRARGLRPAARSGPASRRSTTWCPTVAQTALYLECRRLLDRATRWLLQDAGVRRRRRAEIEHFAPVRAAAPLVPKLLRGVELERLRAAYGRVRRALGAPADLARDAAAMLDAFSLLDVVELAGQPASRPSRWPSSTSRCPSASRSTGCSPGSPRCRATTGGRRWPGWRCATTSTARSPALTRNVLARPGRGDPDARIAAWEERNAEGLARARATLAEITASDTATSPRCRWRCG